MTMYTGALFFGVLLITVTNIVLRNVLSVSWLFMDGLLRLLFIWMVFSGTAVLYYRNDHLVMDFFSGKFSPKMARRIDLIQQVLFLVFMVILLFYGMQITKVRMGIPFETWNLPTGYAYVAVPVNALLMGLFCIEKIITLRGSKV
jgi:TRAP-type C4-dicarboxylate transport system permease small subunit